MSASVSQGELNNSTALTQIAQGQAQNSDQLFGASFPGFQSAEDFYGALQTGDPFAIARAVAPATQQIDQSADAAKANILRNGPAGGEKNLALEQVDVNRGAQVGSVASSGYTGSFNALAQLAGQGVNQSISAANSGVTAFGTSNQGFGQVGQQQLETQQIQAQEKGNTLGAISGLAGGVIGENPGNIFG